MKDKRRLLVMSLSAILVLALVIVGIWLFSGDKEPEDVSFIQLLADPDEYDGAWIRVIGVGNLEEENNCLCLGKDDLTYSTGNAFWIELGSGVSYQDSKKYNGEYVIVEGIFDADNRGHGDAFCGAIEEIRRYESWHMYRNCTPMELYTCTQNKDNSYTCQVLDRKGNVLFSEKGLHREPHVEEINDHTLSLTVQTGTGLSTNWAVYCDIENSLVSETFHYVLLAQKDYVVYADYQDGQHKIVVQNLFDKSQYYEEIPLADCSPVAGDVVLGAKPDGDGYAVVTYRKGSEYTETELTISLP